MAILDPVRFHGTLSKVGADVSVGFTAGIDNDGNLMVAVDPISPARLGTSLLPRDRPLDDQSSLRLEGASDDGWRFLSETFHLHRWSHPEDRVEIEGSCGLAEFSRDVRSDHMHAFHLPEGSVTQICFGIAANPYEVHRIVNDFELEGSLIGRKRRGSYDVEFEPFYSAEEMIAGSQDQG